ncbi:hypothetical protein NDU88_001701 [Pleurodeles waltl]|uniref:Reverse transcriptase domain-containing protein n=1 Tax=Pleurodeles waltl TaxID=8319 RepID=A0AAV7VAH3_PLEWA|nr:hypothetical protein NDU88_001701 [Pleurodeles waltl]
MARALVPIFQEVLDSGMYPPSWKETIVVPLKKKPDGDSQDLNNLRPIAFLAKILEKALNKELGEFLVDGGGLDSSQHGFKKAHSTETALISSSDAIRRLVDEGQGAILELLDLSAAFNTISPYLLTSRLSQAGIRGRALKLLESFLSNRWTTVSCGNFTSSSYLLPCRIPQGSSLSPTLFNLYVAPLADIIRSFGFIATSYADDTQLIIPIKKPWEEVADRFSNCMQGVSNWMKANWLKINATKTEILGFGLAKELWNTRCGTLPTPTTVFWYCGPRSSLRGEGLVDANPELNNTSVKMLNHLVQAVLKIATSNTIMPRLLHRDSFEFFDEEGIRQSEAGIETWDS